MEQILQTYEGTKIQMSFENKGDIFYVCSNLASRSPLEKKKILETTVERHIWRKHIEGNESAYI